MDIGSVQPAGSGLGMGVDHLLSQPGAKESQATQRQLIQAVKALSGTDLFGQDNEMTFVFDRESRQALVRVVNKKTREVVMQIPPESVLRMAVERKAL